MVECTKANVLSAKKCVKGNKKLDRLRKYIARSTDKFLAKVNHHCLTLSLAKSSTVRTIRALSTAIAIVDSILLNVAEKWILTKTVLSLHMGVIQLALVWLSHALYVSLFRCCPDEKTPSLGPNNGGCPSSCQCNRLGSYILKCQPSNRQCYCKPGVGGLRCDRCEPGYWGLHKISEGNAGCICKWNLPTQNVSIKRPLFLKIACKCNKVGSSRHDCEQMTGRCVCRTGFRGLKCDVCADGSPAEIYGCARGKHSHLSVLKPLNNYCVYSWKHELFW